MSPYEIYSLLTDGITPSLGMRIVDDVLQRHGGEIDEACMLILNDTETEEKEPEYIVNASAALQQLKEWPTLGSIGYSMPGMMIMVSYQHLPDVQGLINCVKLSIPARSLDAADEKAKSTYHQIATELHERLKADRTIMEWGVDYSGFSWIDEIKRLKNRVFEGNYSLDLRK